MRKMKTPTKHTLIGLIMVVLLSILFVDFRGNNIENIIVNIIQYVLSPNLMLIFYIYLFVYYLFFAKQRSFYSIMIPLGFIIASINHLFLILFMITFGNEGGEGGFTLSQLMLCIFYPFDMGIFYLLIILHHIKSICAKMLSITSAIIILYILYFADTFRNVSPNMAWISTIVVLCIVIMIAFLYKWISRNIAKKTIILIIPIIILLFTYSEHTFAWGQLTHMLICEKVVEKEFKGDLASPHRLDRKRGFYRWNFN